MNEDRNIIPTNAIAQLGVYVDQLGRMLLSIQQRMERLERENTRRITISHDQVITLQKRIRLRSDEICAKYRLAGKGDAAAFRAAIKKQLLIRYGIKDLHDLPLAELRDAGDLIDHYASIQLVMDRRRKTEECSNG